MRLPMAIANWKMEMTIAEAIAFVAALRKTVQGLGERVEIVLCPAYTALHAVGQALVGSRIALGAQNVSAGSGGEYTSEVSARLLADVGCRWVMLGHWEVRRHLGDTDEAVRQKVQRCLEQGLRPILLVGQARDEQEAIHERLARVTAGSTPQQVACMAFMYEPETAIGQDLPAAPGEVAAGCRAMRAFLRERYGAEAAEAARIVYGGSVAPEYAPQLLASPDVDGLGAGRKGRDVASFAQIIRAIAEAKSSPLLFRK